MTDAEKEMVQRYLGPDERVMLRDRFAMAALTGMLAGTQPKDGVSNIAKLYAHNAYKFADAMFEQRQKAGK